LAAKKDKEPIGVILLNLGGPDSLQAVKPFLYNLFSDRQIIQLGPSFMQKPIAWLISTMRSKKTERFYSLIGGKSPILDITMAQAKELEEALNNDMGTRRHGDMEILNVTDSPIHRFTDLRFKVFVGMRYWHPLIEEVIPEIYSAGIKRLIVLNLYPQYSVATSGSSITKLKEVISKYPIELYCIPSWYNHPLYIEVLVDVMKKGLESFNSNSPIHPFTHSPIHVLFSAHSLPKKFIGEGDPYVNQIMGTIKEITKRIEIKWHLSYQSKSGPVKWLEPSTDEMIKELAGKGIKNVLVVPISFVSDHVETLYEIDILYRQMAEGFGINLRRTESLNTHPLFIAALKDMVIEKIKELGWLK